MAMKNTHPTNQDTARAPVRLYLLSDAPDADGAPRVGLLMPSAIGRRAVLRVFASVAAALAAKAQMEGSR